MPYLFFETLCFAVGVIDRMRQRCKDAEAAYLQGEYVDRRVFAQAPVYFRKYDERGVEYVWLLLRGLYGSPDSGRLWYNTYAHYCLHEETITPMQRCHFEPSAFTHFTGETVSLVTGDGVTIQVPERIILTIYVDDIRSWDNCETLCDCFYDRMGCRFALTSADLNFTLGMDISMGDGWLRITSSTFILGLCAKWLEYPIGEYETIDTPAHPKLMDFYEAAFQQQGNTSIALGTNFRSLVCAMLFPAPSTRPDCLFCIGIHARALTFATDDLYKTAQRCLIYMGQTHDDGPFYSIHAENARTPVAYSDSDWGARRSTTGGTIQTDGASVLAVSRRQDCVTGSSTHAEIVAASTVSNDVLWSSGLYREIGPDIPDPILLTNGRCL